MRTDSRLLAAALALLAGCASAPRPQTYDTIRADVHAAATQPASAVPIDSAVANALLPAPETLVGRLPKAGPVLEERFDVAFTNVPAQQFFRSLAAGTRYNMLVAPDVAGTITANLKDVTMAEALDAVRELYGYDYHIEGTRVFVKALTMQTKMFKVNYLVGQRIGGSSLRVSSTSITNSNSGNNNQNGGNGNGGGGGRSGGSSMPIAQTLSGSTGLGGDAGKGGGGGGGDSGSLRTSELDSAVVATVTNDDFWHDLRDALVAIVGSNDGGRKVVVSPQSGVIVVRAMPDELRAVSDYLKATQVAVERQVILEAKILEVELNDSYQSGINWASFSSFASHHTNRFASGMIQPGTTLQPLPFDGGQPAVISNGTVSASTGFSLANSAQAAGSLFGLAFQTSNFAALLSFLESQGTVHVLSSPRVATLNNQKAVLKIGTDEFFVTGVQTNTNTSATGNIVSPTVTVQPFFSGVVLDVTPQIDEHGNILLHVHPSVSQVSTVTKSLSLGSAGTVTLPLAASNTSEIDSMVRGEDGRVVAIGGLMRQVSTDDDSGLPGASNVPVLGTLFRNKNRVNMKRELVVLIKPTIVDSSADWNGDLRATERRIDALAPRQGGH